MTKLTQKQENFVQSYVRTGNAYKAYCEAYDAENMKRATIDRKAHELLENGKITARLEQIRERTAKKTERTVESIDAMLETIYDKAIDSDMTSALPAAATAAMGIAKLHGLIINKSEDVTPRRSSSEILARLRQLTGSGDAGGDSKPSGGAEAGGTEGETVPTVPGHGTA